ncbi:MAG: ATP-binding protein [Hydrogenophaga sp.]|nr:ATP-binding protein [Hydrogenophaga sp.]
MKLQALWRSPSAWPAGAALVLTLAVWLSYTAVYRAALQEAGQRGQAQMQLQARELLGSVEKFEHLPYLVGADQALAQVLSAPQDPLRLNAANRYLQFAQHRTGVAAIYLMDTTGHTLAASNWSTPGSFVGRNYRFRPYFQQAMEGGAGRFYGVGVTTGEPGFFIAAPLLQNNRIEGVVAVKVDLTPLEERWREAGLPLALADEAGVMFLSAQRDWRYRSLYPLAEPAQAKLRETRQYGGTLTEALSPQGLDAAQAPTALQVVDGGHYLVQARPLEHFGWQLLLFADPGPARRQGALAAGLVGLSLAVVLLALAFAWQYRRRMSERRAMARERARAIEALERRIAERTAELTAANDAAVQTGKLALLGQMAAGISHELSQPLAALHTLADNAAEFLKRQDPDNASSNLQLIGGLCTRMGNIVGELKAFARKEPARLEPVRLAEVVASTLMLMEPLRHASQTRIETETLDAGLAVLGDGIRLEQVLVNLLRNGIDAMEGQAERRIDIRVSATGETVTLSVRDHGPGLSDAARAHLFEPFFTTKPSGKGLGLGLSLSQAIVREMGGQISAHNAGPGARFDVTMRRTATPPDATAPSEHPQLNRTPFYACTAD